MTRTISALSKSVLAAAAALLFLASPVLAQNPAPSAAGEKPRLAVLDFEVIGDLDESTGVIMAERVLAYIGDTRDYWLIERALAQSLLEEQNFQLSDLVGDAEKAAEFGRMLGARYLIVGRVNQDAFVGNYIITVRMVDCESGRIIKNRYVEHTDRYKLIEQLRVVSLELGQAGKALAAVTVATPQPAFTPEPAFAPTYVPRPTPAPTPDRWAGYQPAPTPQPWGGSQPSYAGARPVINGDNLTVNLGDGVSLAMVRVRAGSFAMGSPSGENDRGYDEGPQTRASISHDFWMAEEEITTGQFRQFVNETGHRTEAELRGDRATWNNPGFTQGSDYPVVCVSWNDAIAFCDWLSNKTALAVSLPTETQWEYAARAGASTPFIWGTSANDGERMANGVDADSSDGGRMKSFMFNPMAGGKKGADDGFAKTAPGFRFQPNAWGLRNMSGNAAEWCLDWYGNYPGGSSSDSFGPPSGYERVVRGGSWATPRKNLRVAARDRYSPDTASNQIGFRVAAPAY